MIERYIDRQIDKMRDASTSIGISVQGQDKFRYAKCKVLTCVEEVHKMSFFGNPSNARECSCLVIGKDSQTLAQVQYRSKENI